jgi:hypothetical protein
MANVHKDFHGAFSYGIQFVMRNYGMEGLKAYLEKLADTVYGPLVKGLRDEGLSALRAHWDHVFTLEGGKFALRDEGDVLVLDVHECPAIAHMKKHGYDIDPNFCEHTRILNEAVCRRAGYHSSVEYDQAEGRCVQRFWKEEI